MGFFYDKEAKNKLAFKKGVEYSIVYLENPFFDHPKSDIGNLLIYEQLKTEIDNNDEIIFSNLMLICGYICLF